MKHLPLSDSLSTFLTTNFLDTFLGISIFVCSWIKKRGNLEICESTQYRTFFNIQWLT